MLKKILIIVLLMTVFGIGQVPKDMTYEGVLKDNGSPANGNYQLTFRIYDVATGGSALWNETHSSVSVTNGLFKVILGTVDPVTNPLDLSFDERYWIGVEVQTNGELIPRLRLTSSGYSFMSLKADSAENIAANVVNTDNIQNDAVTSAKVLPNIVSSVEGVSNDGGNIDLIGNGITIAGDDAANTITFTASGGDGNTLDMAYDEGGAGVGRTITADAGAVNITGTDGMTVSGPVSAGTFSGNGASVTSLNANNITTGGLHNARLGGTYSNALTFSNPSNILHGNGSNITGITGLWNPSGSNIYYNTGNLGIGTSSPSSYYALSIYPGENDRGIYINHDHTTSGSTYGMYIDLDKTYTGNANVYGLISYATNNGGTFSTQGTYGHASGTSTGNKYGVRGYAIGTGNKYGVYGNANGDDTATKYGVFGSASGSSGTPYGGYFHGLAFVNHPFWGAGFNDQGFTISNQADSDEWMFYVQSSNDLWLYFNGVHRGSFDDVSGNYTPVSDKRLKKNIEPLSSILEKVMRLEPKKYHFKENEDTDEKFHGFIAQDVEKIFPELVSISNSDEKGGMPEIQTLSYTEFIPIITKALQEQQKIIEELKQRIDKLENK